MKQKNDNDWKLVSEYTIQEYRCGLKAGDSIRIVKDIIVTDYNNKPTGEVYKSGEVWAVLRGVSNEPDVIWLKQADGERHTWDEDSIFEFVKCPWWKFWK